MRRDPVGGAVPPLPEAGEGDVVLPRLPAPLVVVAVTDFRRLAEQARDGETWAIAQWNQGAVTLDHYLDLLDRAEAGDRLRAALEELRDDCATATGFNPAQLADWCNETLAGGAS